MVTTTMGTLEMEEVEDLIAISSSSTNSRVGKGTRRSTTPSKGQAILSYACEARNRNRILTVSVILAFLLLLFAASNGGSGSDDSVTGHLSDVEGKPPKPSQEDMIVSTTPDDTTGEVTDVTEEVKESDEDDAADKGEAKPENEESTPDDTTKEDSQSGKDDTAKTESEPEKGEPEKGEPETKAPETEKPVKKVSKIPVLPWNRDHLPVDETTKEGLTEKWGHWHFWDGDAEQRPKEDFCAKYANRDVPGQDFPDDSWQVDAVYVNHYLNDADELIVRAMEAIFTEYGHGKPLPPEGLAERFKMFHWEKVDLVTATGPPEPFAKKNLRDIGGWTTRRSFRGLVRRLLHAMITQDTFTVVMGGHSAAMGAGNHFRQSYMMQFHAIMEPIFARLGVKLITRNMAQGGLGTVQAAMGMGGIYGEEIDLLLWDSGMTENPAPEHIDLFLRQALISGNRVPVVWGGDFSLLQMLHNEGGADVGEFGTGMAGIATTMDEEQALTIPWAARYMKCDSEHMDLCETRFNATCWIDRPDGIKPEATQLSKPPSQVKWHPGWRSHQLQGRVLAFAVLEALQVAVNDWSEGTMSGQPLDDDYWHVTEYYENIRSKVQNLDPALGSCYAIKDKLPTRLCNTPMKGRTQYTPRAYPDERSIAALLKPAADGYVPSNNKNPLYDGPDVHNPVFDVPEGEIDVVAIVSNRRRLERASTASGNLQPDHLQSHFVPESAPSLRTVSRRQLDDAIVVGKGWEVFDDPQGYCDGTYEAICDRDTHNSCFLYGHHDQRGAVIGNEKAGWLVMELKGVKEGIIVLKLHTWHFESENARTRQWENVNDEESRRRLGGTSSVSAVGNHEYTNGRQGDEDTEERKLMRDYSTPELAETFKFEFAINGKVTSWNKDEFLNRKQQIQRVVETVTLLDDADFANDQEGDVEVAIRMRDCDGKCTFGVSHIYWA